MRSQLTRNAHRRLLAGGPGAPPCPASVFSSYHARARCLAASTPSLTLTTPPRRTFFGVFKKPARELKAPDVPPGYETLLQFRALEVEDARPPEREGLVAGFKEFFNHMRKRGGAAKIGRRVSVPGSINSTQAFLAVRLLRHLLSTEGGGDSFTFADLKLILEIAVRPPRGKADNHLELVRLVYGETKRRIDHMRTIGLSEEEITQAIGISDRDQSTFFAYFITALTRFGASQEAVERMNDYQENLPKPSRVGAYSDDGVKVIQKANGMWMWVLRGLANEGLEDELIRSFSKLVKENGVKYLAGVHEILTTFYAERNRVEETKKWFSKPLFAGSINPETYMAVVRFALRNNEQEWLESVMEDVVNSRPTKQVWDVVFQWAVLAKGKGVEDIKGMFKVMGSQKTEDPSRKLEPDGDTINSLISAAAEINNPYLAERFAMLGRELRIPPTIQTMLIQLDYRLDAGDMSGAAEVYGKLQKVVQGDEDVPVVNKYLRTLCTSSQPPLERIISVTADLEHRHITLEPETTRSLCGVFLRFDQQFEVIDTLSLHTVSYSLEERAIVRQAMMDYITDRKISTARVWDCYQLLKQFFPETSTDERVRLMDSFFDRKRPDMACYIFGHMRGHGNPAQRPNSDIYVKCFEGIGRFPDAESLRMVHNMLKMDTTVEMNTKLYNGLMLAYAACGDPIDALGFWRDITNSREGPSYNSLAIVMWACELAPRGEETAREIWKKMVRMDLEIPKVVFDGYLGALAASGKAQEEVKKLIGEMERGLGLGYGVGVETLGVTFNAIPTMEGKNAFADWAKVEHPEVWGELEKTGRRETIDGPKYNIERRFEA
ncbi:uncharacterized protein QC763_201840 [Podospora pseudopauciseta]|uniref:Complex I intermediate-associated protein 84, mitochondrial n=1 Tax=Podospora pseudopauciseta TaxID=2093780 RepID=A0ABR0HMM3_9PEZI|nr:hypothetical protein QC763_201840 [Podospora pseudopauciseta]